MIINKLTEMKGGFAREILNISADNDGFVDISDDEWGNPSSVIQNICFEKVKMCNKDIYSNFVGCSFYETKFIQIVSDGHFWGSNNSWDSCKFDSVKLFDVISPLNYFKNCSFDNCMLNKYRPYQTVFEKCSFKNLKVEGMKAQIVINESKKLPSLVNAKGTVLFRDCCFEKSTFLNSYFEGIQFENCEFENSKELGCFFEGVHTDNVWWDEQQEDPFLLFVFEVLIFIENKFGQESGSYKSFNKYFLEYSLGKTKSKDYSACLYDGSVPDSELDIIEKALDKIENKFTF